jgi:hypothetical protein
MRNYAFSPHFSNSESENVMFASFIQVSTAAAILLDNKP